MNEKENQVENTSTAAETNDVVSSGETQLQSEGQSFEGQAHLEQPKPSRGWMYVSILLAAILVVVLIKPPFASGGDGEMVAEVNGSKISKGQLYDKMVELGAGNSILTSMIDDELWSQEVKKANISISEEEILAEIESIKSKMPAEMDFDTMLMQYGMTLDDLKKAIIPKELEVRKMFQDKAKTAVTEESMKQLFEDQKAQFGEDAKFEDHKADIEEGMTNEEINKLYESWFTDTKNKAKITNKLEAKPADEDKGADPGKDGNGNASKEDQPAGAGEDGADTDKPAGNDASAGDQNASSANNAGNQNKADAPADDTKKDK